jgi:KDO2-lipid IV(A) lauroyltransferase
LVLYKVIRLIPIKAAYALAKFLFRGLYIIDRKHRIRSIKHLQHANAATNEAEARVMAQKAFCSFAMLLVEIIKMDQHFSMDKLSVRGNPESIKRLLESGENNQNAIIVTAHYGNWELAGSSWAEMSGIPMVSIMRPFGNPLIGNMILRNRQSSIHQLVDKDGGIRGILKALRQKKNVAILADQHAGSKEGLETIFFGQPCRTHTSPALLHLKTGVPIVTQVTRRIDDKFNFEFVVGDIIEYKPTGDNEKDIQAVTQMYTTGLEKLIKEQPEQWMWAHRRWLNIHRKHYHAPMV